METVIEMVILIRNIYFIENLQLGYSAIRFQEEIPLAAAAVMVEKLFTVSIGNLCNDLILHLITVVRTKLLVGIVFMSKNCSVLRRWQLRSRLEADILTDG